MNAIGWSLFDTRIGRCGIAWSARGIVALQLPEGSESATTERMCRKTGDAPRAEPPVAVEHAIDAMRHLLEGERTDLRDIALDLEAESEFHRAVYQHTRAIPAGETKSYGDVARAIGEPHAARAVGQALGANPLPILVPCHRVLASDGSLHGFSARGGISTKQRLLEIERAQAAGSLRLFE